MASVGCGEMVLARRNWSPIKSDLEALSIQSPHKNLSVVCIGAKSKGLTHNYGGIEAPMRRVCLFHIIGVLGTMLCENSLLVAGLAKADEERNDLRVGHPSDGIILQGFPYTATLERPTLSSLQSSTDEELEEILSVKLKLLRGKASAFRIFINLPDADESTPVTCFEFSGAYFHEPRRVKSPDYEYQVTIFRIGIGDIIKGLGLTEEPSILVTFVPCGADKGLPVVLQNLKVELD